MHQEAKGKKMMCGRMSEGTKVAEGQREEDLIILLHYIYVCVYVF